MFALLSLFEASARQTAGVSLGLAVAWLQHLATRTSPIFSEYRSNP